MKEPIKRRLVISALAILMAALLTAGLLSMQKPGVNPAPPDSAAPEATPSIPKEILDQYVPTTAAATTASKPAALPPEAELKRRIQERGPAVRSVRAVCRAEQNITQQGEQTKDDFTYGMDLYPQSGDLLQAVSDASGRVMYLLTIDGAHYSASETLSDLKPYEPQPGELTALPYLELIGLLDWEQIGLNMPADAPDGPAVFSFQGLDGDLCRAVLDILQLEFSGFDPDEDIELNIRLAFERGRLDLRSAVVGIRARSGEADIQLHFDLSYTEVNNLRELPAPAA